VAVRPSRRSETARSWHRSGLIEDGGQAAKPVSITDIRSFSANRAWSEACCTARTYPECTVAEDMIDSSAPHLTRTLTLGPVALFGLAYMAPMIVLGTFGVLDEDSGGVVPTA
jgi:hypothetical protein